NLCTGQVVRDALFGNLIGLNTCQSFRIRQVASAGEYPGAAEIIGREIIDADRASPQPEFERVHSHRQRGDVGDLKSILLIRRLPNLRAATLKSFLHVDRGNRVVGSVAARLMIELKTRLVDRLLVENRGLS